MRFNKTNMRQCCYSIGNFDKNYSNKYTSIEKIFFIPVFPTNKQASYIFLRTYLNNYRIPTIINEILEQFTS